MARRKTPFRIGMIGANRRSLWYGAMFERIDPCAYAVLDPWGYHHMVVYHDVEPRVPRTEGLALTKIFDPDLHTAREFAAAFRSNPEVCTSLAAVSDDVDLVLVVNEIGDGSRHRDLSAPGLRKGVATFVDRPLTRTVEDAHAVLNLARRHHAPLLSCSHLRMSPHLGRFKTRYAEIGPVEVGMVQGVGHTPATVADGIELTLCAFGDDFDGHAESVQSMGGTPLDVLYLRFAKGSDRVLQAVLDNGDSQTRHRAFFVLASSQRLPVASPDLEMWRQTEGGHAVLETLKTMVATQRSPLTDREMLEPVAVAAAGRQSHSQGHPVALTAVRSAASSK